MKSLKFFATVLLALFTITTAELTAQGQTADDQDFAKISSTASGLRFDLGAQHAGATLTIATPDGRIFRKVFKEGSPEFSIADRKDKLPDGHYSYELRLTPVRLGEMKAALDNGRGKNDESEDVRAARKPVSPTSMVQSGGFSILNGAIIVSGATEEQNLKSQGVFKTTNTPVSSGYVTKVRRHHLSPLLVPDQVIPDDLIVQGSACVGLDCVNGEVFGFDTIRVKENNTRIQFDDTSGAGFPTNNWQIRANSSAGGGESFLGFVDQGATGNSETGTVVFQVNSGAPANSLKVSSTGRVGLRTGTPVLDLHINTGDTPAHRLEQNSGSGFTAQTWDIAGNEANFFVRDVTGGSRLPFRIRPGAPTSSIDISASGNVGIGIASPQRLLHMHATATSVLQLTDNTSGSTSADGLQLIHSGANSTIENQEAGSMSFRTSATDRVTITSTGSVGIATTAPTDTLSVNGTASKPGGGTWAVFSDERLKTIKGNFTSGLKAVLQLQPLRYEYRPNNALMINSAGEHVGFSAQEVATIVPEAVTKNSAGYLMVNNDPIIWTMLNAIKEQQAEIAELRKEVRKLRATSRRRK